MSALFIYQHPGPSQEERLSDVTSQETEALTCQVKDHWKYCVILKQG